MPEKSHGETLDFTMKDIMSSDIESDEDDKDYSSTWSKKWSTTSGSVNNIMSSDIESDEDEVDRPPTQSKKWSTGGSVTRRSSPVQVYTYKVTILEVGSARLEC